MADVPSTGVSSAPVVNSVPSPAEAAASDFKPFGQGTGGQETHAGLNENKSPEAKVTIPKLEEKKASNMRKLKLKVDGEEFEENFNPDDDDYITKQFQMAKVSQKRMQETAALRKQVQGIENYLAQAKGDPKKLRTLLRDLGADEKALAASIIDEEIANSQKSPEQLATEKLQNELQRLKDESTQKEQEYKAKEFERLQAQEYERYDMQISKAIESSDLPKQPYVIKKMADYMLTGLKHNISLTPEEIMPLVREEIANDIKEMFAVAPDSVIEALVGKDVLTRLRKNKVAKATGSPTSVKSTIKDTGKSAPKKETEPAKKLSYKNFFGV
jgi:hypothetical protein